MSFIRKQGKTKFIYLPVTVSTTFSEHGLVDWTSGFLTEATSTSKPYNIVGAIRHPITAADDDYAVARLVEVEVPVEVNVVWTFDVTSGLVAADRGLFTDLTDNLTVNRAASTLDIVQITKVLSTTKGEGILNIGVGGMGVIAD